MCISGIQLKLANYLQENHSVDLHSCAILFDKSPSTIKRYIYSLNDHLPRHLHFKIKDNYIYSNIEYLDYINLCNNTDLSEYTTVFNERSMLIICYAFFENILNTTSLYKKLNLSLSTKKKDREQLGKILEKQGIKIINHHRKGIELIGNERYLRMYVARKLISVIELDEEHHFTPRRANSPIERLLYKKFEEYLSEYHNEVSSKLEELFNKIESSVDYKSKKFIYVHTAISLLRLKSGHKINPILNKMPRVHNYSMLPSEKDSEYLDYLINSLNYKIPLDFPQDTQLKQFTDQFIKKIEEKNNYYYSDYQELFKDLYSYFYKCQIKNKLDYYFYDDKLNETQEVFASLYDAIQLILLDLSKATDFSLTKPQVSVVCLIIKTHNMKNEIVNSFPPKIIIITNSSVEKVNFFEECLFNYIDYIPLGYLTLNELYKLNSFDFDYIFTFSNRIQNKLTELGRESIKLNFYLNNEDVKKLIDYNFPTNKNKSFIAQNFVNELERFDSSSVKISYLRAKYPRYFL